MWTSTPLARFYAPRSCVRTPVPDPWLAFGRNPARSGCHGERDARQPRRRSRRVRFCRHPSRPRVVTLKLIANNLDIKEGMTHEQIDAAIARHADTETLYDQPYENNKRVRVCGPFSVESLSPHRVLSTADEDQDGTVSEQEGRKQQDFATMILENLKKAGVQNTRKSERLSFGRLDPYAGTWLHAAGEYTDAIGKTRRVAVSIGPEHSTVSPRQVKEAAKEAVQGVGFDMLVVCGFAFDPH